MCIKLKIGRNEYKIDESDIVMDNGSCIQVITKETGSGWNTYPLKMSKNLFNELKNVGFLYTNDELIEMSKKRYGGGCVILYKFNIEQMSKFDEYKIKDEATRDILSEI